MSTSVEIPKTTFSPEDWEYFGGVLDQAINLYGWIGTKPNQYPTARAEVYNTSDMLINLLAERFGGHSSTRPHKTTYPFGKKPEGLWCITRRTGLVPFLDVIETHLHFQRPLVVAFRNYVRDLEDGADAQWSLQEFQRLKEAPASEEKYLPSPRNLAGRFDANGFIGIYVEDELNLRLQVRLGTEHEGMIAALKERYGGGSDHGNWVLRSNYARAFLEEEIYYLQIFRERANLASEFSDLSRRLDVRLDPTSERSDLLNEVLRQASRGFDLRRVLLHGFAATIQYLNDHPV